MERAVECTQEQLDQFAKYHFNTALFRGINLNERRIRIYSMFTVTETGAIENISVRAPHPVLAREMERVLALLPRLRPAREAGEAVSATYTFPIIFTLG
jgi:protein TonB